MALHVVLTPLAVVLSTVNPQVGPEAVNLVLDPRAIVHRLVSPGVFTPALLLAHIVVAVVSSTFGPRLNALAVLLVVLPLADVISSLGVEVLASTVSFVVTPHSLVDVSISVVELAHSTSLIELPGTFILGVVRPHDSPFTVTQATYPASRIGGASAVLVLLVLLFTTSFPEALQSFHGLFLLEVLGLDVNGHLLHPVLPPHKPSSDEGLHSDNHHGLGRCTRVLLALYI